MKYAKSMYFGGDIVFADECNYQSAQKLGLKCPFCNSAVFLRSESVRHVKGKLQLISPYFAHYSSGYLDNWDCDNRSRTKSGREEVEHIKFEAKNQRLKLYNNHLWNMFVSDRNISHQKLNIVRSYFGERWCEQMSISIRREWSKSLLDIYAFIDATLRSVESKELVHANVQSLLINKVTHFEEYEKQNQYLVECDRRLHRAICYEIAKFLGTDTAGFVFLKLFKTALFVQLMLACSPHQIKQESPQTHIMTISGLIAGTHWIEQVQHYLSPA